MKFALNFVNHQGETENTWSWNHARDDVATPHKRQPRSQGFSLCCGCGRYNIGKSPGNEVAQTYQLTNILHVLKTKSKQQNNTINRVTVIQETLMLVVC